ncbi:MAG: (2Fe-2S)-binding protein [Anaerolineales bacterium]|jgi:predicted molibdopterin-dependent oxidoreductase YjgC
MQKPESRRQEQNQYDGIEEAYLNIRIDHKEYYVRAGISVAAALIQNGIRVFRETDDGANRGVYCGMGVCYDCLVSINGLPDQRACMTLVKTGMQIETGGAADETG